MTQVSRTSRRKRKRSSNSDSKTESLRTVHKRHKPNYVGPNVSLTRPAAGGLSKSLKPPISSPSVQPSPGISPARAARSRKRAKRDARKMKVAFVNPKTQEAHLKADTSSPLVADVCKESYTGSDSSYELPWSPPLRKLVPILPSNKGPGSNRLLVRPRTPPSQSRAPSSSVIKSENTTSLVSWRDTRPTGIYGKVAENRDSESEVSKQNSSPESHLDCKATAKSPSSSMSLQSESSHQKNTKGAITYQETEPDKLRAPNDVLNKSVKLGLTWNQMPRISPPSSGFSSPVQWTNNDQTPISPGKPSKLEAQHNREAVIYLSPIRSVEPNEPFGARVKACGSPKNTSNTLSGLAISQTLVNIDSSPSKEAHVGCELSISKPHVGLDSAPIDLSPCKSALSLARYTSHTSIPPTRNPSTKLPYRAKSLDPLATPISATPRRLQASSPPSNLRSSRRATATCSPSPTFKQKLMSTVKSKVRSFIDPVFDVIVYRQEGAADPPPGVSPLVHKLPDSSVHTYRRLLTPGHGPSTCSNPHISWNTPHDPKWYTAKQAALALKSNRMRKKPYTGALILARRWALEDKLRGDTGVPEFSDRELSYMELGMKRKNGADVVRKAQMLAENLPKVLVVRMAQQLEPHELQLAGLDMVPETEPFWCFVVLPGARDMSYES